jgi:hypothetical protein
MVRGEVAVAAIAVKFNSGDSGTGLIAPAQLRLRWGLECLAGGTRMTTLAQAEHAPPRTWEQFEELCADVFAAVLSDPGLVRHGRAGQRQHGVDIVARGSIGLQCKRKSIWPVNRLTVNEIDSEVAAARKFRPRLASFYILTTAPDDAGLQKHARLISRRHASRQLFDVHILGWNEICRRATLHSAVAEKHFGPGGSGARAPLLAVWFVSGGRLELKGQNLALSCRELAHDLRDYPAGRVVLRQRESDMLASELASYEGRNLTLADREARLAVRDKLARNERLELYISSGLKLMLGDPTISSYVLEVYRDSGDAARAVAGFINHELDPQKGFINPETIRLRVRAPKHPDIWQSHYISQAHITAIEKLRQERNRKYGHGGHSDTVGELPDKVRGAEAIPAVISAILRELEKGENLDQLRKAGILDIGSWSVEFG